ncbi:MAG TPA: AAA family ATPase [Vicinamibacterales bacterium]|jgi:general secretion pathway protein A
MSAPFDRTGRSESASSAFLVSVPSDIRPSGLTYEPFYGLKEKPFSLTSDSRFFYQSRAHAPAFDDLLNAIRRRESLNALTGDVGTGKTTLCRAVLESLDRKTFSAFVRDPFASREELLKVLLADFGVASTEDIASGRLRGATRTELHYVLQEFLATLAPLQAFAVVIIDEAQNLSPQLLEEVRILSDAEGLLQVVLVGQLELRGQLARAEMRQLDQRVSVHCQLQALDVAGVAGYISHRLHVAGGSSDRVRFTGDAVEAIYARSGGVPRVINRLCDRALHCGYSRRDASIDAEIVAQANPLSADGARAAAALLTAAAPIAVAPLPAPPLAAAPIQTPPPPAVIAALAPFAPDPPPPHAAVLSLAPSAPAQPQAAAAVAAPRATSMPADVPPPLEALASIAAQPAATATAPATDAAVDSGAARQALPAQLESWLAELDGQPAIESGWSEHSTPRTPVAPQPVGRRAGLKVRIPAGTNPYRHTHADRMRRRWTRRFVGSAVALILLLAAIVAGPAAVAASVDILSSVEEQFTPPAYPLLPVSPATPVGAPARIATAAGPLDSIEPGQ